MYFFEFVGELCELIVDVFKVLGKYLVYKGFIVVNGVLLMVNCVEDLVDVCCFLINLILYMVEVIMFKYLKVGSKVNLEIDLIVWYVECMLFFLIVF